MSVLTDKLMEVLVGLKPAPQVFKMRTEFAYASRCIFCDNSCDVNCNGNCEYRCAGCQDTDD